MSIRLAVITLWTSLFNWTAMFKEGGKKWAGSYRPVRLNVIIEKSLKLILEEKLIISQKVNLKIDQGLPKLSLYRVTQHHSLVPELLDYGITISLK